LWTLPPSGTGFGATNGGGGIWETLLTTVPLALHRHDAAIGLGRNLSLPRRCGRLYG